MTINATTAMTMISVMPTSNIVWAVKFPYGPGRREPRHRKAGPAASHGAAKRHVGQPISGGEPAALGLRGRLFLDFRVDRLSGDLRRCRGGRGLLAALHAVL